MVNLGNLLWVAVEPWASVQLQQLVFVRLVVQGGHQLRLALQLLEVVQFEFQPRVQLGLPYFRFV